ncbi:MAG: hypothetical protein Q9227_000338 [Pyrenula ochraceoflavens]
MPSFSILYFASASSYTGRSSELIPAPMPLTELFAALESRYPGIEKKILQSCAVTVNLEYVDMEKQSSESASDATKSQSEAGLVIQSGDEVALIPPVSSG